MNPQHITRALRDNPQQAVALIIGIISAIATIIQIIQPPKEHTTPPITVNQGDSIAIQRPDGSFGTCVIGYINHEKNIAYTAGHCAAEDEVQPLDPRTQTRDIITKGVTGADIYTADASTHIGTVTRNGLYEAEGFGNHNDWLEITLDPQTATLGENVYSHNRTVDHTAIHPGDTYCMYVATKNKTQCGFVVKATPSTIFASPLHSGDQLGYPGDSSAPVWIERPDGSIKGFWGLHAKRIGLSISHTPGFEGEDKELHQPIHPDDIALAKHIYLNNHKG